MEAVGGGGEAGCTWVEDTAPWPKRKQRWPGSGRLYPAVRFWEGLCVFVLRTGPEAERSLPGAGMCGC